MELLNRRKLFKTVLSLLFVALSLLLVGCDNSTSDEQSNPSGFTYDGQFYSLTQGRIYDHGQDINSYDFDIALYNYDVVSETSDTIYLDLNFPGNTVTAGDFIWSTQRLSNTVYFADVTIDEGDLSVGEYIEATTGAVKITAVGAEYELSFTLTLTNGKNVTGYYKGPLTKTAP